MKLAIITDIHQCGPNKPEKYPRILGEQSHQALSDVLHGIQDQKPSALIHLGDAIIANSGLSDEEEYTDILEQLSSFESPSIHLIGNHELRSFNQEEISSLWQKVGLKQTFYGQQELEGYQLIWLGIEKIDGNQENRIPDSQLTWLQDVLSSNNMPTIVCSHHPLAPTSSSGNTYFDQNQTNMRPQNYQDAFNIISKHRHVIAAISGHAHWLQVRTIKHTHFITLPSMAENIAAPGNTNTSPQVYSILTLKNRQLTTQCFSKDYAFAHIELSIL